MTPSVEALLTTLPRKIKIGAYDWRVRVSFEEGDDYGEADFQKAVITLWPLLHQSPERLVGTLLHELLHVIYANEEMELIPRTEEPVDIEETIVKNFETGLVSVFRDNPKLLTWINRGFKFKSRPEEQ